MIRELLHEGFQISKGEVRLFYRRAFDEYVVEGTELHSDYGTIEYGNCLNFGNCFENAYQHFQLEVLR